MTISSYSELKTALANWTHRADLTGRDDEAIDNFEASFNRRMKMRFQEATATGTTSISGPTISLPTGFTEVRTLSYAPVSGALRKLEYITPEQAEMLEYTSLGPPKWYTFVGGSIRLYPTPDQAYAYTVRYYQGITALSSTTGYTSNWLLSNNPDVYLYGSLVELCAYTGDDPRLMVWKQKLEEGIQELERADRRERFVSPVVQFDAELKAFPMSRDIYTDGE